MFTSTDYLDFSQTDHASIFSEDEPVWSALGRIGSYLEQLLDSIDGDLIQGTVHERAVVGDRVYIAPGATVEANAVIKGPAWIDSGCTVRSGAYIRANVIAGDGCVLGNSCEFKNCLLFNHCEVPHFNYVGDSILGHKAHLGAGGLRGSGGEGARTHVQCVLALLEPVARAIERLLCVALLARGQRRARQRSLEGRDGLLAALEPRRHHHQRHASTPVRLPVRVVKACRALR